MGLSAKTVQCMSARSYSLLSGSSRGWRTCPSVVHLNSSRVRVMRRGAYTSGELDASITSESLAIPGEDISKSFGFGFSAGGLLFPYLVGVMASLREEGIMTDRTPVAGSSAGSIVAVASASGLTADEIMEACLELAHDYRTYGTRKRMSSQLLKCLESVMPEDIHERCNNVAHIGVTKLFPTPQHNLVCQFTSRDDLMKAVLTSCHIPLYFDGDLFTSFRGSFHYDGGLTDFIPVPPGVDEAVKVCCFPSKSLSSSVPDIEVSPDSFDEDFPHSMGEMISWAFEPADEGMLLELYERGQRDGISWASAKGLITCNIE